MKRLRNQIITAEVRGYRMEIEFDYTPAMNGRRESLGGVRNAGPAIEPDEPESVEITRLKLCDPLDMLEIVAEEVNITLEDVEEAVLNWIPEAP